MATANSPDSPLGPNARKTNAEQALVASDQRLAAQSAALTQLMARYADSPDSFGERIRGILSVTAHTLGADRVSMWRFERGRDWIVCANLYERVFDRHGSGLTLSRAGAPRYFEALDSERVIDASDARNDARTNEFLASYLVPNEIHAMLDVPLRQNGVTVGVFCAEHTSPRAWSLDEQHFAIAIAHLMVAALADEERRAAVARLADSESRARLLIDTAPDAFIGIDSSGRIITWNSQAERTFGWTRDEALGRNLVETLIPPAFREAHIRGMERFHQTGEAPVVNQRLELVALHRTGREFPVEITITSPMRVEGGYFFGAFLRDISDRRERDDQLRRAKESAEAATRAKSEFLANMSHELRTPLNGVLGYAQLLQRDRSLDASQREALEAIAKGGAHLLDLINDVLDLSRIEAGRLDIEASTTDLAQMAIDLKYLVAEAARRKGLLLGMAIAPDTPRRVVLDGRHLRQVLLNLLNNAIKFTARGEVHLSIAKAGDDRLFFEVSDTGVGIDSNELVAIFEAFTQTKAGAAAGGSGLGLAISQHLIAKMGGVLQVQSQPGQGSRFYFDLPLAVDDASARVGATDGSAHGATEADLAAPPLDARLAEGEDVLALVADDSTVNRRILAALLESAGVRVITAAGGLEAVALTQQNRPNVVFMDLKMADLDGFEATRRLQADPATAEIPVVAVTASAFGDTRTAALDSGCVDYLPKPVRAGALFAVMQKHLGVKFVSGAPVDMPAAPPMGTAASRRAIAARLAEAIELGAVTDLEAIAQELMGGEGSDAALGRRIGGLAQSFDFDGLRALAAALESGDAHAS
jgi:PAS domain S-box-containing protein